MWYYDLNINFNIIPFNETSTKVLSHQSNTYTWKIRFIVYANRAQPNPTQSVDITFQCVNIKRQT